MTATKPESTAVATQDKKKLLDLNSAKMEQRFIEAFGKGQLDRLKPEEQTMFLMAFGNKIGVRAELGELMIYQGKPYITIDGRIRIANAHRLNGGIQPRPASEIERRAFGATEDEVLWICDAYRVGSPKGFKGWGLVNARTDKNPVARQFPRQLAKKRATYDALRLAFPPDEDIGAIHTAYIEEAEELARQHARVAGGFSDPEELPALEGGDEVAQQADPSDEREPGDEDNGELPLGDDRPAPKQRNAVSEGR